MGIGDREWGWGWRFGWVRYFGWWRRGLVGDDKEEITRRRDTWTFLAFCYIYTSYFSHASNRTHIFPKVAYLPYPSPFRPPFTPAPAPSLTSHPPPFLVLPPHAISPPSDPLLSNPRRPRLFLYRLYSVSLQFI